MDVAKRAHEAKAAMAAQRPKGEQLFAKLLSEHATDGIVYLRRAEAYEQIGELGLAAQDYDNARRHIVGEKWRQTALEGLNRVSR